MDRNELDRIIESHRGSSMTERSYTADDLRRRARLLAGAANRAQLAGSHNRFAATTSDGERYYLDMAGVWRRMALECLYWANLCDKVEEK